MLNSGSTELASRMACIFNAACVFSRSSIITVFSLSAGTKSKNQMNVPIFSLCYTSVRAATIPRVVNDWSNKSETKSFEWIIAVDAPDQASQKAVTSITNTPVRLCVQQEAPWNCVKGWNLAAANSTGKVIIAVADDFNPPMAWDSHLLALSPPNWVEEERVIHVNDGYVRDICVLGIITRKRYERFGYFFYPQYESVFCDTELTATAQRDGVMIEAMHLLFEHLHPDCGKRQRDQADLVHASSARWQHGESLFKFRQFRGFPVDAGPKTEAAPPVQATAATATDGKYCAYLQVTRDDFCLYEVCRRLTEEGVKDFFMAVPSEYWSGRPTPLADIEEVGRIAEDVRKLGTSVEVKVFTVPRYRYPGDTRIDTETRLRNDSLAWIRGHGFKHILIVDGDELWMRGTLELIKQKVQEGCVAISSPMIPVAGLPGYPIDPASDVAVVYIGGSCIFRACRTPMAKQSLLAFPKVIHFTATRRTLEDIAEKHRASGHYDDKNYAMDEWIVKVLPHIKPGFVHDWGNGNVGLHMYQPSQIWQRCRHWRVPEIAEIPESLAPYLDFSQPA